MVNVVTLAAYRLRPIGLVQRSAATWRCVLHSSDKPGELSQWQCAAMMTKQYKSGCDRQSVQSAAGKLSCNKTALKRCTKAEILLNR